MHEPLFEPLIRAVQIQQPDFCFKDIHIVTRLVNLRQLYRLSIGKGIFYKGKFQIDVEVVGNIVFLCRSNQDIALGVGHGFEERCVVKPTSDKVRLTTYHRISRYRFGGISLLVQLKGDAVFREDDRPNPSLDDFEDPSHFPDSTLLVHKAGKVERSDDIVELESQEFKNKSRGDDTLAKLYLSGTRYLMVGLHSMGHFEPQDIRLQDMTDNIENWAHEGQSNLRGFASLLDRIRSAILEAHESTGWKDFRLVGTKGKIKLFRRMVARTVVPDSFEREWLANDK